jgi:hypothetical protein
VVLGESNSSSSGFFANWARQCMVEQGWVKPLANFIEQVPVNRTKIPERKPWLVAIVLMPIRIRLSV